MTALPFTLRPYQHDALNGIRGEFRRGHRRTLLVMPTGAGKTATAAEMVGGVNARSKKVLWLVDREELADQASEAFDRARVPHSYFMAGEKPDKLGRAWVGTIQSFLARVKRGDWIPSSVDLLIVDEAHRAESKSYQDLYALYPDAFSVGLTATPMRGDGRGLGNTYAAQVTPITTRELMDLGILTPARYFLPSTLATPTGGNGQDFTPAELQEIAAKNPQLIGDVVENYARICPTRRGVVFPMTIPHSRAIEQAFNSVGIPCVHVDGSMKRDERQERMRDFRAGEYQLLTSVNIAIEGLDVPDVSAVVLARPTKSERIWVQAVGRGLRSHPGKQDCVVLDHAGVFTRFGPVEDFTPPTLHAKKGKQQTGGGTGEPRDPAEITCEECKAVFYGERVCPQCGHEHEVERAPRWADVLPDDLVEAKAPPAGPDEATLRRWYAELLGYCLVKGKKPGAAYHLFQQKFKTTPGAWQWEVQATTPGAEVLSFCKSRAIAYAKGRAKGAVKHAAD